MYQTENSYPGSAASSTFPREYESVLADRSNECHAATLTSDSRTAADAMLQCWSLHAERAAGHAVPRSGHGGLTE